MCKENDKKKLVPTQTATSVFILTNLRWLGKQKKSGHNVLEGACFTVTRKEFRAASLSPSLSSTDTAHSLLRLCHLLAEDICSCSPVPTLCPLSGPRPFSSGCLLCSPLLKSLLSTYSPHLLLFTPWSLLLFMAFSVLLKFKLLFHWPC